ncbi:MAG: BON domain-containing protein [Burkholderiales bacterium]|nr:BON domain-containing protein [Burkholderiales bacterium]
MIERIHLKYLAASIATLSLLALSACDKGAGEKTSMAGNEQHSSTGAEIAGNQGAAAATGTDATLTALVRTALAHDPDPTLGQIDVQVLAGRVSLQGQVPTQAAHERALQLAGTVAGVRGIDDRLSVNSSG